MIMEKSIKYAKDEVEYMCGGRPLFDLDGDLIDSNLNKVRNGQSGHFPVSK